MISIIILVQAVYLASLEQNQHPEKQEKMAAAEVINKSSKKLSSVKSKQQRKNEVLKLVSFNYSKAKTEETSSEASFDTESNFNYLTIVSEEEEREEAMKKVKNVSYLIEMDPQSHVLYIKRCKLYIKLGKFDGAAEDAKSAICIKNDSVECFMLLAKSLSGLNRFGESEMAFKRAIELVNCSRGDDFDTKKVGVRFKEDEKEAQKRNEEKKQTIYSIERDLRHLRYNTLHSMGFDPILSLKVSTKSTSITDAIRMMTHECESLSPVNVSNVIGSPVTSGSNSIDCWNNGTNISQRIQFINSSGDHEKKSGAKNVSNQRNHLLAPRTSESSSAGSVGSSYSESLSSSLYSTPSPSPPVVTFGSLLGSSGGDGGSYSNLLRGKPSTISKDGEQKMGNSIWQSNSGCSVKVVESVSRPYFDQLKVKSCPSDVSPKNVSKVDESVPTLKVVNNNTISMFDVARELKVLNSSSPASDGQKKVVSFVDKVSKGTVRPTNIFKFNGIWVGGVSPKKSQTFLMNMFSKYGRITSLNHLKDNGANCMFVNYTNDQDSLKAVVDLNGKIVPSLSVFPNKFMEVRLAPTDAQMVKYAHLTREKAVKIVHEAGECFGWRNSEGCPNPNTCKFAHKNECREIDSQPWIRFAKLRERLRR